MKIKIDHCVKPQPNHNSSLSLWTSFYLSHVLHLHYGSRAINRYVILKWIFEQSVDLKGLLFPVSLAAAWLPRWAASWHCHAPEQRHPAAACIWASQQRVSAFPLPAHQDLLLCTRRIPYSAWRCPASQLFCLLRFPGGSERWHGPSYTGSVYTKQQQHLLSYLFCIFKLCCTL